MGEFLKGVKSVVHLFTVFPISADWDVAEEAGKHCYLLPLLGALLGATAAAIAYPISLIPSLRWFAGYLAIGFLVVASGALHVDGLMDFGDGVLCTGPREKRIEAMKDESVGAGGAILGFAVFAASASAVSQIAMEELLPGVVLAEALAKLWMGVGALVGRSAHPGFGLSFIEGARRGWRWAKLLLLLIFSAAIAFLVGLQWLFEVWIASSLTFLAVFLLAHKLFGGLTGDVFGAINELCRLAVLLAVVARCGIA